MFKNTANDRATSALLLLTVSPPLFPPNHLLNSINSRTLQKYLGGHHGISNVFLDKQVRAKTKSLHNNNPQFILKKDILPFKL